MPNERLEEQRLRAFVEEQKRAIQDAEAKYDVKQCVVSLVQLISPLVTPEKHTSSWKALYLRHFYRDVCNFLIRFVVVHLEVCLSPAQRHECLDIVFTSASLPASKRLDVLITTITTIHLRDNKNKTDEDQKVILQYTAAMLEQLIERHDILHQVFTELVQTETSAGANGRELVSSQPLIHYLASLPDLIYNRCERQTPTTFMPSEYFPRLLTAFFDQVPCTPQNESLSLVFRMLSDKLVRIGQTKWLIRQWCQYPSLVESDYKPMHQRLLSSLSPSSYEHFMVALATYGIMTKQNRWHYRLIGLLPPDLMENQQFQFVIAHKLLLKTPLDQDLGFLKALVDVFSTYASSESSTTPVAQVFGSVLERWSASGFSTSHDYRLLVSITCFLRYTMLQFNSLSSDWIELICKGVQEHMKHSSERVRQLGMRMGESVSRILSPEQPLDFELDPTTDPLQAMFLEDQKEGEQVNATNDQLSSVQTNTKCKKKSLMASMDAMTLDPDAPVCMDDDEEEEDEEEEEEEKVYDSDSDVSLEAYDLNDDEDDLGASKPFYLKDLIATLQSDDDEQREKKEVALAEAEALLRKRPRDLQYTAKDVAAALLRLEDRYHTPNFQTLRSNALAAVCVLAPTAAVPYLITQVLEREQMLQSRFDGLQAMITASQELSGTGAFQKPLPSSENMDLDAKTMQQLRTRRWGVRKQPAPVPQKNAFADVAMAVFFAPLLFGYVDYAQSQRQHKPSDLDQLLLAHVLHALASFVESAGNAPSTVAMAKCLLEFAAHERQNATAAVRRQVLFCLSRVLLVVPTFLLQQECMHELVLMLRWLQQVEQNDPDDGCREASRVLLGAGLAMPTITLP